MQHNVVQSLDVWNELERDITAKVGIALRGNSGSRSALVLYLRDLEVMARAEYDRRQTVQIIASGRSLLGDRSVLGPSDVPFANDVGLSRRALEAPLGAS